MNISKFTAALFLFLATLFSSTAVRADGLALPIPGFGLGQFIRHHAVSAGAAVGVAYAGHEVWTLHEVDDEVKTVAPVALSAYGTEPGHEALSELQDILHAHQDAGPDMVLAAFAHQAAQNPNLNQAALAAINDLGLDAGTYARKRQNIIQAMAADASQPSHSAAGADTQVQDVASGYDNTPDGSCGDPPQGLSAPKKLRGIVAYIQDIQTQTGLPIQRLQIDLLKQAIVEIKYTRIDRILYVARQREYKRNRLKMIAEWEQMTGQAWPRYAEPVVGESGSVFRDIGHLYDAHHIIELDRGGLNEWWNIHPAATPDEHQGGIHGKDSPLNELHDIIDDEECE